MSDDDDFVATVSLDAHEWRGLQDLANALDTFEPLDKRGNLGKTVTDRLVSLGLAEQGSTSSRYQSIGLPTGFRLTTLGWKIKERGRHPHRR